ncbi:MAG: TRAP transporter permease [Defluviitaleaceae bacterium]|nr:TRAP transporter permease [Defluviitaleaceae bacterium]
MDDQKKINADIGVEEEIVQAEEIAEKMAQVDRESNIRHYAGVPKAIIRWMCVAFTLFALAINTVLLLPPQVHRSSFVALIVFFAFLLYPANRKNNVRVNYIPWYDVVFAVTGFCCFMYYALRFETIVHQMATFTQIDFIVAVTGIIILFIGCYRITGMPLIIVVGSFIAYAYLGQFIPGQFGHAGYRVERIFTFLFYTTEGVIGTPIGVASTFIFAFMLFGAFLDKTGIGQFFIDIASAIAGKAVGGPAKMVVIASALLGTVSGSSVANTVASGSFTIPLMKRLGYDKNYAGAVEAASSTGGQLLPPILGAAAFLMAEITGIPYTTIALAAIIPAILYFVCIFASVHFEAKKLGLRGMPPEEIPRALPLIIQKGPLMLGVISIIAFLYMGFTPTRSAFYAILVSIAVSMIRKETRLTPKAFVDAFEMGARNVIGVGVACAMAGMVVGVVVLTGLGITFANSMLILANNIDHNFLRLFTVLFLTMIASLILGLGVPTTAKYIIMATVTAPILVNEPLGLPVLVAHMFVFHFGTDADITPPVGLASYAASAISRGSPLMTSVLAMKIAASAYILPYIFAFNPQMLLIDTNAFEVIKITVTGTIGIVSIAAALTGFMLCRMGLWERIAAVFAGIVLAIPGIESDLVGIAVLAAIIMWQKRKIKRDIPAAV